MTLADQKCVPCEGGVVPLNAEERAELAGQVPKWEVHEDYIERTFEFSDFIEAMKFANRITKIAEEENPHPDLHISWGKLRAELTTHAIGGLSTNDFVVAAKIDKMAEDIGAAQSI